MERTIEGYFTRELIVGNATDIFAVDEEECKLFVDEEFIYINENNQVVIKAGSQFYSYDDGEEGYHEIYFNSSKFIDDEFFFSVNVADLVTHACLTKI